MQRVDIEHLVMLDLLLSIENLDKSARLDEEDQRLRSCLIAVIKYYCRPYEFETLGIKEIG